MISATGGELVTTSAFNCKAYGALRTKHGAVQGSVIQAGAMMRTTLPKATTALPEHTGLACLRALTTGLLILYDPGVTVGVLQNLIPYALVQLDQEDAALEMARPLLTSLRQYVLSIATEEDANTFRDVLLEEAAAQEATLTGVPLVEIMKPQDTTGEDINFVVGLLRWILTPYHRRKCRQYPTRSLRAWTTSTIMAKLGFDVHAALAVVRTVEEYSAMINSQYEFDQSPDVFLVLAMTGKTDPIQLIESPTSWGNAVRPQIIPVRAIPSLAFKHLRGAHGKVNTQYLVDVWNYSFACGRKCFGGLSMQNMQVKLNVTEEASETVVEAHRSLVSAFSPHLNSVCGPSMRHFVPDSPQALGWNAGEIMQHMSQLRSQQSPADVQDVAVRNLVQEN